MGSAEYKVPGGKLLCAETDVLEGKLLKVKVYGDFFMHPETAIEDLEEHLTGIGVEAIEDSIEEFFGGKEITLYGVAAGDFSHVIKLSL
jgi:hypothetical protein